VTRPKGIRRGDVSSACHSLSTSGVRSHSCSTSGSTSSNMKPGDTGGGVAANGDLAFLGVRGSSASSPSGMVATAAAAAFCCTTATRHTPCQGTPSTAAPASNHRPRTQEGEARGREGDAPGAASISALASRTRDVACWESLCSFGWLGTRRGGLRATPSA